MVISRRKPVRSKGGPRPDTVSDTVETEPSYTWRALVDQLVTQHATLTRVAELLAESRGFRDDVASIERALRRLRARHAEPGGLWGARLLARFGLPDEPARRARWMGTYHSRFTDLPVDVCESLLRLWDAGPVRESRARVWIELGYCAAWLRRSELDRAERALLGAHALLVNAHPAAEVEWALGDAFVASLREAPARSHRSLSRAKSALDANKAAIEPDEHACLLARWTDQRAFALNQSRAPEREREAEALYAALSERDAPAFARCRRENGLAYARMRAGDRAAAIAHAERAARAAGDAGALRLRAMALLMLVKIKGPLDGADELARAAMIARELGDAQLAARVERQRR